MTTDIIPLQTASQSDLLALNNAFAAETSYQSEDDWARLVGQARFGYAVPPADGFLIGMDQSADYHSPNFLWFKARFDRFAYVDRIVIAASAHGQGLGRALYERMFDDAKAAGFGRIVAEVNAVPPNPTSLAFHERLGFAAIGEQTFNEGKTVRYFERRL